MPSHVSASALKRELWIIENLFVIDTSTATIDSDLRKSPLYFPLRLWENEEGFASLYIQRGVSLVHLRLWKSSFWIQNLLLLWKSLSSYLHLRIYLRFWRVICVIGTLCSIGIYVCVFRKATSLSEPSICSCVSRKATSLPKLCVSVTASLVSLESSSTYTYDSRKWYIIGTHCLHLRFRDSFYFVLSFIVSASMPTSGHVCYHIICE